MLSSGAASFSVSPCSPCSPDKNVRLHCLNVGHFGNYCVRHIPVYSTCTTCRYWRYEVNIPLLLSIGFIYLVHPPCGIMYIKFVSTGWANLNSFANFIFFFRKWGQFINFHKLYLPSSKAVLEQLGLCNGNGQKQDSVVNKGHFCYNLMAFCTTLMTKSDKSYKYFAWHTASKVILYVLHY